MSDFKLDITKEHCPMTFVKVKLQLAKMQPNDRVSVLLTQGEPLSNVPKSAAEQGYNVLNISQISEEVYQVIIEK